MNHGRIRDDFSATVITSLAKRSGFECAICKANTIGPSTQSPLSVSNIGVAAHITAAASGGPRYDASLNSIQRRNIENGIWLCQNHAKSIDADTVAYTVEKLCAIKQMHEDQIRGSLGIPQVIQSSLSSSSKVSTGKGITAREFAFVAINALKEPYRSFIAPILDDCALNGDSELGVLMCIGTTSANSKGAEWTSFVEANWLHWFLNGQRAGYKTVKEISPEHIYGRIPSWPDGFTEFLEAIVLTNSTFWWQRHADGYLVLAQ